MFTNEAELCSSGLFITITHNFYRDLRAVHAAVQVGSGKKNQVIVGHNMAFSILWEKNRKRVHWINSMSCLFCFLT